MMGINLPHITLPPRLRQAQLSFLLVLPRNPSVLMVADLALLFACLLRVLLGGSQAVDLYQLLVVLPTLVIGVPLLADTVTVERRAGSIELALTSPTPSYFERRATHVGLLLLTQDLVILGGLWLTTRQAFPLVIAIVYAVALVSFVTALTLFWAVHLRTTAAVLFASTVSIAIASRWILVDPTAGDNAPGRFTSSLGDSIAHGRNVITLLFAAVLLWLYARRRLTHPEHIL